MPRHARLDAPGLAHHVMARGLDRQPLFRGAADYQNFLRRIPQALERSPNQILAWALMPNHVHFFIRSGARGIAGFFRRLLTGYAVSYNQRHRRVGHLFQNRYKSIVCDQDEYFLTLVRYIHLNPLVAGLVKSLNALGDYPYTGHGVLMNRQDHPWQETDDVLNRFGKVAGRARQDYQRFLSEGLTEVKNLPVDVLGGGVLQAIHEERTSKDREDDRELFDSRILGSTDFIQSVWDEAEEREAREKALKRKGISVRQVAKRIAHALKIPERLLFMKGRSAVVSEAKAALIFAGVEHLGQSQSQMASLTKMSRPAASKAWWRGQPSLKKLGISKLIS